MRIYGTSPLYSYVELIFRCKRMFIVAILVGTVITSYLVYARKDSYDSKILIALTGDPDFTSSMSTPRQMKSAALRKTDRLALWLDKKPEFLQDVARDAGLDRKRPGQIESIGRQLRDAISMPKVYNNQYMEISINWGDPEEADAILQKLYGRFSERTVDTETVNRRRVREALEEQFKKYDTEANEKAKARVQYLSRNYWQQSSLLSATLSRMDQSDQQISDTRLDIADAQVRLQDIDRQLQTVKPTVNQSTKRTTVSTNPTVALLAKKNDLELGLKKLLDSYSPQHPKVIAAQREIATIDAQIEEAKKKGKQEVPSGGEVVEIANPLYQRLNDEKSNLTTILRAQERRLSELQNQRTRNQARVVAMPREEVQFQTIQRDYELADKIRNNMRAQLAAARIEEEQDRITQQKSVSLEVPPKAEKSTTRGKAILLYVLGPLLGLIVAFSFSLIAESLDHTLRTPVEVEKYLGKPVLAVLPKMQSQRESRKSLGGSSKPSITS